MSTKTFQITKTVTQVYRAEVTETTEERALAKAINIPDEVWDTHYWVSETVDWQEGEED